MFDAVGRDLACDRSNDPPSVEQLLGLTDPDIEAKPVYRIGDLASDFDVSLRSLRFYEQRGLLRPARRGATRLYSLDDRHRLRLILLCKLLGFSLAEIRQIANAYFGTQPERQRSNSLRKAFEQQRGVLQAQSDDLDASLTALNVSIQALDRLPSAKR